MLIYEMLEETVKRHPQNIAVKYEDRSITFLELNKRLSRLATFLYHKGVKEGDRVALVAEKSIESVVSIFGILKSGAMYVPIDPTIPKERLEYILKDCGVNIVIITENILKKYREILIEKELIVLTIGLGFTDWSKIINNTENCLDIEISEEASAYIMYTSGSTGEPKGVEIYHRSVTNLMQWYTKEFSITSEDKILSFVPFWFDASICDIFSMVKTGAMLVLPPEGINMFPNEFAKFLVDEEISLFFAPSSQFVLALPALKEFTYPHLKTVMFGAEELAVKYVRELQNVFSQSALVNIYGPTECTDVVTFYRVPKQIPKDMEKVPIGRPYSGISILLINEKNEDILYNGEIGEIMVLGPNIMKGYWNKPTETKKIFGWWQNVDSSCRFPIYFTGDLACKDINCDFVYVGRKDRMIKSMGRRIQLEEIEHVLNGHPLIKEAVVVGIIDEHIESRISIECYVVPLVTLVEGEIIRYCRTRLPDYMVPTKVYVCESLPKTSNGKLNRRELK